MAVTTYLLLGSNLGDRQAYLQAAIDQLMAMEGLEITAESPVYCSLPVGVADEQPSFLNQVIKGDYLYPVSELLQAVELIELKLDRTDKGLKQPRTIDIDILLFGDDKYETDTLIVPHPRLTERAFALVPLLAIDPELTHPVTGKQLASYLSPKEAEEILLYQDHVSRSFNS